MRAALDHRMASSSVDDEMQRIENTSEISPIGNSTIEQKIEENKNDLGLTLICFAVSSLVAQPHFMQTTALSLISFPHDGQYIISTFFLNLLQ